MTTVTIVEQRNAVTVEEGVLHVTPVEQETAVTVSLGGVTDHGALSGLADDDHPQYLPKAGGTMTGALTLAGAPSADLHAATKLYVDSSAGAAALNDLTDVDAPAPADMQVLTWNNGAGAWVAANAGALGNFLRVNAGGGADYTTVTAALAAAQSGDTVLVYPGVYTEAPMTIPAGVNLVGFDAGSCFMQAPANERGPIWTFAGNNAVAGLGFRSSGFAGLGHWTYTLCLVQGATLFSGCTFQHVAAGAVAHTIIDSSDPAGGVLRLYNCILQSGSSGVGNSDRLMYGIKFNSASHQLYVNATVIDLTMDGNGSAYGVRLKTTVGQFMTGSTIVARGSAAGPHYSMYTDGGTFGAQAGAIMIGPRGPGANVAPERYPLLGQFQAQGVYVSPFNANTVGQIVRGAASQAAHLQEWQSSAGDVLMSISENGYLKIKKTTAPADAELDNDELVMWWDQANDRVMWKAKNNSGVVKTGELALT